MTFKLRMNMADSPDDLYDMDKHQSPLMVAAIRHRVISSGSEKSPLGVVRTVGRVENGQGSGRVRMRVLGMYAVVYLLNGSGRFADDRGRDVSLTGGDMVLVFPDVAHRYGPVEGGAWNEIYIMFEGPVFDLWRRTGLLRDDHPVYHLEPIDYWGRRLESVVHDAQLPHPGSPLSRVCRLQDVLSEALMGSPREAEDSPDRVWAAEVAAVLARDLSHDLDLHALASRLRTTYGGLRKRFTRAVGVPPARYRARKVIDHACELMLKGKLSDKQIAYELNFCDEFHFSRRFKQFIGMCPREFRRRASHASSES